MLNGLLKDEDVNGPSSTHFVSEFKNHVLIINLDQKSESSGLENKLDLFWDLESISILDNENHSPKHFKSFYLSEENRYETKLLFKGNRAFLHNNFDLRKKRLEGSHGKQKQDPNLLTKYNDIFIAEKEAGIIEEVSDNCEAGE